MFLQRERSADLNGPSGADEVKLVVEDGGDGSVVFQKHLDGEIHTLPLGHDHVLRTLFSAKGGGEQAFFTGQPLKAYLFLQGTASAAA